MDAELREWFALHNGSDQGNVFPQVPPGHRPMTLAELVVDWRSLVGIWAETTTALEEIESRQLLADPAGTTAFTYLPSFIPIAADNTRCRLVVDTRTGTPQDASWGSRAMTSSTKAPCAGPRSERCTTTSQTPSRPATHVKDGLL